MKKIGGAGARNCLISQRFYFPHQRGRMDCMYFAPCPASGGSGTKCANIIDVKGKWDGARCWHD
jgi:hypothetical protein